jgi:hypothetical protein
MRPIEDKVLIVRRDGQNRSKKPLFLRSDGSGGFIKGGSHMDAPYVLEWTISAYRRYDIDMGIDIPRALGFRTIVRLTDGNGSRDTDQRTGQEE